MVLYTVKKFSDFSVPSHDVTNLFLQCIVFVLQKINTSEVKRLTTGPWVFPGKKEFFPFYFFMYNYYFTLLEKN